MTRYIFDCDGVLLDWFGGFRSYVSEKYGIHLDAKGPKTWDMVCWFENNLTNDAIVNMVKRYNTSDYFGQMDELPFAKETLWAIHNAGYRIDLLTACGDSSLVQFDRVRNLMIKFNGGIEDHRYISPFREYNFLPLGSKKYTWLKELAQSTTDELVLIEDNYDHALDATFAGVHWVYCIRSSYNQDFEKEDRSGVIWIDDLRGVEF